MNESLNPFAVTRAMDFSDEQIFRHWVEPPGDGGVWALAKPSSPMPMIILGGKGSGKTHMIRFLSTVAQLAGGKQADEVLANGYLGIYLSCGGINAARFEGKGQSTEVWESVFHYYIDLALSELCLITSRSVIGLNRLLPDVEASLVRQIVALFDEWIGPVPQSLDELHEAIANIRRAVDLDINNCAMRRTLDTRIRATPGVLTFGIPSALSRHVPHLARVLFVYLIDELENLRASQQKYINSLVRENRSPCSFKVGARLYGLRTLATHSSEETLKEGSEYERLTLDERFRAMPDPEYAKFVIGLCVQRLRMAGVRVPTEASADWFKRQFASEEKSRLGDAEVSFLHKARAPRAKPWLVRAEKYLEQAVKSKIINCDPDEVKLVLRTISSSEHPVVERMNLHMLYQKWGTKERTVEVAREIAENSQAFVDGESVGKYANAFQLWRADMIANICRDCERPLRYVGIDKLIRISHGFPRHLLILLKHVYGWSAFHAESPFVGGEIGIEAQRNGVKDASEWFFKDVRLAGPDGSKIRDSVSRIAELLRAVRYSDKPSEVSLCAFSIPFDDVAEDTRNILDMSEKWSLISAVGGGRPGKNSFRVDAKYQLNPLLAPRWDLSISVRGDLPLSAAEADTVFTGSRAEFDELVRVRTAAMMGPRFGIRKAGGGALSLFGDDDA